MDDKIVEPPGSHEPTEHVKTPKKAAASGWIGSALEYYDFFIYAQAAALVFPTLFFPSDNPQAAIVQSFATFGVGYVARPIGAFVLGHWGDTHGRKNVLVLCMLLIGASTFGVALLPTYSAVGVWAPILLVILISWGIALVEYCFAVPANRIGYASGWSPGQLKIAQEAIALVVFGGFMVAFLGEPLHWRHLAAFACIMAAVGFLFWGRT
jgi:uncharacterized protein (DUF486 family)